jgi:hypothetical protein
MRTRGVFSPFVLVLALAAVLMPVACGQTTSETGTAEPLTSTPDPFTPADAYSFSAFPVYWLGRSFDGLPLSAVTRRADADLPGEHVRANYVGFVYGDCVATDETGCPPPLEVQIWPACERSLADYALTPAGDPLAHRVTFVRGVPAALFERGLRLELYTEDVTIVVFGLTQQAVLHAAAGLRAANALGSERSTLPPPLPGAMAGRLRCKT